MVSIIVYFSPLLADMIQFDKHIFVIGWFNHQLVVLWWNGIQAPILCNCIAPMYHAELIHWSMRHDVPPNKLFLIASMSQLLCLYVDLQQSASQHRSHLHSNTCYLMIYLMIYLRTSWWVFGSDVSLWPSSCAQLFWYNITGWCAIKEQWHEIFQQQSNSVDSNSSAVGHSIFIPI